MTTLSSERVDVLTGTVSNLSRSAQLSMSLANLANKKDIVDVAIAAEQDSFLQTVLALHHEGKMEKNFLLWLAHCLQHEPFIVFAEATILPTLFEVWQINNATQSQLSLQLSSVANDSFNDDLFAIAEIIKCLPTIKDLWLTSEELENLLRHFILDENFLLLSSKVNVLDYQEAKGQGRDNEYRNTIESVLLHWVSSRYRTVLHRLVSKYRADNYYDFSFEQFVKYLPPFALLDCHSFAYQFDWSQNIRIAIPELTQKEAHIFNNHQFVDSYPDYDGRRYIHFYVWSAKVKNLGGNLNLAFALHNFRHNNFDDLAFWASVMRFCVTNETVLEQYFQEQTNTYTNLFGYLAHKRQEEGNRFEMKGRTLRVVMQQSEEWY